MSSSIVDDGIQLNDGHLAFDQWLSPLIDAKQSLVPLLVFRRCLTPERQDMRDKFEHQRSRLCETRPTMWSIALDERFGGTFDIGYLFVIDLFEPDEGSR